MLTFDTTGIESYVAENNPKFFRSKEQQSSFVAKSDPSFDPSLGAAALMPKVAASNPAVKLQYINGRFCYAQKAAIVANGLGIVRHLELLDEDFKQAHPEMQIVKRTDYPELDKEIGDSTSLMPVLTDFRAAHPTLHYSTFSADSAFDSYDNYRFLIKECKFSKVVIPINPRGGLPAPDLNFNEAGRPLCPIDGTPFYFHGVNRGAYRSTRFKYICPKSRITKLADGRSSWRCLCNDPCSSSPYGRCVYTYPDKNLRLYPGLPRDSEEFEQIYNRRTAVERSINSLKDTLGSVNIRWFVIN